MSTCLFIIYISKRLVDTIDSVWNHDRCMHFVHTFHQRRSTFRRRRRRIRIGYKYDIVLCIICRLKYCAKNFRVMKKGLWKTEIWPLLVRCKLFDKVIWLSPPIIIWNWFLSNTYSKRLYYYGPENTVLC